MLFRSSEKQFNCKNEQKILIFLADFADAVPAHKFSQVFFVFDEHDLLKFSCIQIFKTGDLFSCADTASENRLLRFCIKRKGLSVFLFVFFERKNGEHGSLLSVI